MGGVWFWTIYGVGLAALWLYGPAPESSMKTKILLVHNFYQQPGGEDQVFAGEAAMLEANGHEVVRFTLHNDAIKEMGDLHAAGRTIWSTRAYRELHQQIRSHRPGVVHFHNTFPLISPAAYFAARAEGTAVVQTLHNFRLLCLNALLFRDGQTCESCLGRCIPWPGIVHKCYRGSRPASAAVATMLGVHRALGTWRKSIDAYIALTAFGRRKLIEGGLPAEKVVVKPNFVHPDPGVGSGGGGYALFLGRFSHEKGIETLLAAWPRLRRPIPLKLIGDGELAHRVRTFAEQRAEVQWLGRRPIRDVYEILGEAAFVVLPSECYENFPRVAVEAFAKGTPMVASDHGAMAEVVEHGRTGLLFKVGDPEDFARQVDGLLSDPTTLARMRREARQEYEGKYTGRALPARNYNQLMAIYRQAISVTRQDGSVTACPTRGTNRETIPCRRERSSCVGPNHFDGYLPAGHYTAQLQSVDGYLPPGHLGHQAGWECYGMPHTRDESGDHPMSKGMVLLRRAKSLMKHVAKGRWRDLLWRARLMVRGVDVAYVSKKELELPDSSFHYVATYGPDFEKLLRQIEIPAGSKIIDIGCGKGIAIMTMAKFPFSQITGCDLSPELIRTAEANLLRPGDQRRDSVLL